MACDCSLSEAKHERLRTPPGRQYPSIRLNKSSAAETSICRQTVKAVSLVDSNTKHDGPLWLYCGRYGGSSVRGIRFNGIPVARRQRPHSRVSFGVSRLNG